MGKKIIITAGPTNERIDSVMKITNMSTGSLGRTVAETIMTTPEYAEQVDRLYYISPKLAYKPVLPDGQVYKLELIQIESAEDLLAELKRLLTEERIDLVVHSAAVGDYKAKYSVRGEDLAREIAKRALNAIHGAAAPLDKDRLAAVVLDVLDNPSCAADDSGKMSSYEPHLLTMMDLTPKVIGCVKETSPDTMLIGFKLLDGVSKDELFAVADRLRRKNRADYIVANDLSRIGNGGHWAMVIGENGIVAECDGKAEIAQTIARLGFHVKED